MNEKTVSVPNISCAHCAATIRRELGGIEGVQAVEVDVASKRATIRFNPPAVWEAISRLMDEIGFPPRES